MKNELNYFTHRYTVRINGTPNRSTWVRHFAGYKLYMADGSVFSKSTHNQLPYSHHKDSHIELNLN